MKYPVVVSIYIYDSILNKDIICPAVIDLDINTMIRFHKGNDNSTMLKYKDGDGYLKLTLSFWDFLKYIKKYNNLDISLEELVRIYDSDSLDDMLLNGI